jgi:hypothetical protein
MSVFNPEMKEFSESGYEAKKFSPDLEAKLRKTLKEGKETFLDIVQCPNRACGNPLRVELRGDAFHLRCPNCGWQHLVWKHG